MYVCLARFGMLSSRKGHCLIPLSQALIEIDRCSAEVSCRAADYPSGWCIEPHAHNKHQLIYAVQGVMLIQSEVGYWVVPPTRGVWVPAGMRHSIQCVKDVYMRNVYVKPDAIVNLPTEAHTVAISPLLRELIKVAADIQISYDPDSREGRLMRLILDEVRRLPVLPLHLPLPLEPRIYQICRYMQQHLDDSATLSEWAVHLNIDVKTIQRLFAAETGMTFGQWRQQARLLRALELLAQGEKIVDVALALGYDSPSAFATMFKRQFGQTPSRFFME